MENEQEIDERALCPDGACTGLIGDDGHCGTCGRAGEAPAARPAEVAAPSEAPTTPTADLPPPQGTPDDDARVPCDDGMCVGVLGADGCCGTCGRRAAAP
jgi:hypothetical protein